MFKCDSGVMSPEVGSNAKVAVSIGFGRMWHLLLGQYGLLWAEGHTGCNVSSCAQAARGGTGSLNVSVTRCVSVALRVFVALSLDTLLLFLSSDNS